MPLWFYDLGVYCLQVAIVILAGGALLAAARIDVPRARLLYLKILLAAALILPPAGPWRAMPATGRDAGFDSVGLAHFGGFRIRDASSTVAIRGHGFSLYDFAALLLLAGFLLRMLWLGIGLLRMERLRSRARALGPHPVVDQLRSALGVSPSVLATDEIVSPVTYGWRTPCVFLPGKFERMDAAWQRAILCHEFLHVRRRDWLWQSSEEALRSLFWFHPAVSWLVGQIRLAREEVVDQNVVAHTGSRGDYLKALLGIAATEPRSVPAPPFLSEGHLKRRVALILKEPNMPAKKATIAVSLSLAALFIAGATAVRLLPMRKVAAAEEQAKAFHNSHYAGWVNGPVSYIITPAERAKYENLTTNRQRAAFIKGFWARRNPHPGSARNAYKEEFYHRVAYATEHLGATGIPGWRTDRGHIYVLWGPPDEIDSHPHPKAAQATYPYEVWSYKNLPGEGRVNLKFIDRTGNRNYQLARGSKIPHLEYEKK